jgi:hypothetical protein
MAIICHLALDNYMYDFMLPIYARKRLHPGDEAAVALLIICQQKR